MANSVESWIVNFHGVGPIKRPFDPGEENVWLEEKTFCSMLDEIVGVQGIEITFDDGNASDIEIAISALLSRGLKASFFIPVGKLGTPGFLQESNIRTLIDAGMEIGSHGWAHRSWRKLAEDDLAQELIESRKRLQDITGVDVLSAACPFGDLRQSCSEITAQCRLSRDLYKRPWACNQYMFTQAQEYRSCHGHSR